jgi:SAM-dependent methyltransferase
MEKWKYYDIRHKSHLICNPMNEEKFEKFCKLLRLKKKAHVLDIACGKGEFLVRLAELYGISGVGVDLSPYCIKDSLEKYRKRVPNSDIKFLEMDGAKYTPESYESYDLAMCIGASWIYGGYRGTIVTLRKMIKLGGLIVVGQPFWVNEPSKEYLNKVKIKKEDFNTHQNNVKKGEEEGLTCIYTLVSNCDDWDHYESLKWWNVNSYVRDNPNDDDIQELLERTKLEKDIYLQWERELLGWGLYIFQKNN